MILHHKEAQHPGVSARPRLACTSLDGVNVPLRFTREKRLPRRMDAGYQTCRVRLGVPKIVLLDAALENFVGKRLQTSFLTG